MIAYFPNKNLSWLTTRQMCAWMFVVEYNLKLTEEGYLHLMNQYLLKSQKISTSFYG
jgi:hypothetical protein